MRWTSQLILEVLKDGKVVEVGNDKLERIKDIITKGIVAVNIKISAFLEISKIKTRIITLQNDIKSMKYDIGSMFYQLWERNESDYSKINDICQIIQQKLKTIEILNEDIIRLKNQEKEVFGGKKIGYEKKDETESVFICSNCKAIYQSEVKFCRKCGNKI